MKFMKKNYCCSIKCPISVHSRYHCTSLCQFPHVTTNGPNVLYFSLKKSYSLPPLILPLQTAIILLLGMREESQKGRIIKFNGKNNDSELFPSPEEPILPAEWSWLKCGFRVFHTHTFTRGASPALLTTLKKRVERDFGSDRTRPSWKDRTESVNFGNFLRSSGTNRISSAVLRGRP